jgi:hypothetical protein
MTILKEALAYILKNYPQNMAHELSNARVTKMLYLADWHQAINRGNQITSINWYFDNYGPYVNDVRAEAEANPSLFKIMWTNNMYGQPKLMLGLNDRSYVPNISPEVKSSLDHVLEQTQKMYWDSFIKLVYSTYPITSSDRYSQLDLINKASEYRASQEATA